MSHEYPLLSKNGPCSPATVGATRTPPSPDRHDWCPPRARAVVVASWGLSPPPDTAIFATATAESSRREPRRGGAQDTPDTDLIRPKPTRAREIIIIIIIMTVIVISVIIIIIIIIIIIVFVIIIVIIIIIIIILLRSSAT